MLIREKLKCTRNNVLDRIHRNKIRANWDRGMNFGDAFNPLLLNGLTRRTIRWVHSNYTNTYLMCAGSILHKANANAYVWGSGFMTKEAAPREAPRRVFSVRGPKTRDRLLELGIDCPEIYGDPALLIPLIYKPKIKKKYRLGIVPHYVDQKSPLLSNLCNDETLILNIIDPNHYDFIDDLLSCERIVSSSLHGIILADAYNIPSIWIELSDKVKGDGFKFLDYFSSVRRPDQNPYRVTEKSKISDLYSLFYSYSIEIDLDEMINAFPGNIEINRYGDGQ